MTAQWLALGRHRTGLIVNFIEMITLLLLSSQGGPKKAGRRGTDCAKRKKMSLQEGKEQPSRLGSSTVVPPIKRRHLEIVLVQYVVSLTDFCPSEHPPLHVSKRVNPWMKGQEDAGFPGIPRASVTAWFVCTTCMMPLLWLIHFNRCFPHRRFQSWTYNKLYNARSHLHYPSHLIATF